MYPPATRVIIGLASSLVASLASLRLLRHAESTTGFASRGTRKKGMSTEDRTVTVRKSNALRRDFRLAYKESLGFFEDITDESWIRMKERAKETPSNYNSTHPLEYKKWPNVWYQLNWQPNFSCPNERLIGGLGDGAKWVCNPHRIREISDERINGGGDKCLIYSVGSNGNFLFEEGIQEFVGVGTCEIHIFDMKDYSAETPDGMFFHPWGLRPQQVINKSGFKSLQETVQLLGHEGRVLDIFKIDCEGCEWSVFGDWFTSGVDMRQILVETHLVHRNSNIFFQSIQDEGFVTFHKEANTLGSWGANQEYAFLKVDKAFFE